MSPATDPNPNPQRAARARLRLNQALAVRGLPPSLATLATGRVYAVYASRSPARDALFWKTAANALLTPVNVLSTRAPGHIASALKQHGLDIDTPNIVHPRSNVCALKLSPTRDGCDLLMEALQGMSDQCASPASPFLIEGVAACFAWDNREKLLRQGAALADWCATTRHTVLMVMLPPLVEQGQGFLPLTDFQVQFAGAAQLVHVQGEYRWEVAFWRDHLDATAANESIPLRFSATDQHLVVSTESTTTPGMLAPDEGEVIVAHDVVARERTVPKGWRDLPNNESVVAEASHAIAATVILHYGIQENLATIAKQVNFLRRQCGKALKILIREDNVSIRYEHVLLTLGANAIIPRSTPLAQVQVTVDGVQGQLYSRPVPDDYRAALSAAMRDSTTGYVPAQRFIDLVREAVERSRPIRLPNVLLRLPLEPDVASLDALRACRIRRTGDLCTAAGDSLYVFFFACYVDDATKAMSRVFARPLAELFRGELRCGDRDAIAAMLDALQKEIAELPAPDYTGLIEPLLAEAPLGDASAPAEARMEVPTSTAPTPGELGDWSAGTSPDQSGASTAVLRPTPQRTRLPMKARV
ncbi:MULTISPECIES: cellulose biosynthesis protein BcsE [Dyella]|uniref:Cellulose biosynthesis protein BcsE n=2 Tax=Dyella TaxID=231454 RepID=A0A4R0Z3W3_9GAMM|nr:MULTISPECIES: cellulose biosynthesis protein BcsE [Dyella]TBR39352.1 cellulose biosynthesis protein BcsE [Dyella terrae]TCI13060.1 cellulose biosynthesis protein BcsE [Dyella soli]